MTSTSAPPAELCLSTGGYGDWRDKIFHLLECKSDPRITTNHRQQIWTQNRQAVDLHPVKPGAPVKARRFERVLTESSRAGHGFRETSMQAAMIICAHVRFDILQRVKLENLMDAPRLLADLKFIAQPFRFLELPTEVRRRVYSFLPEMPQQDQYLEVADISTAHMSLEDCQTLHQQFEKESRAAKTANDIMEHARLGGRQCS
ncbi:hypothetical protein TI39_contig4193g00011 [Zymoseptoria brevis]|uniref:Uncharacterized protein n=1 Tax=Zymoseptoria brevis TaxID=1047168 RepID=A0A0F4GAP6_9PEZI|nr:hypothetical protein TI39_contig4193g00011 [Zymoseptoria brevis]